MRADPEGLSPARGAITATSHSTEGLLPSQLPGQPGPGWAPNLCPYPSTARRAFPAPACPGPVGTMASPSRTSQTSCAPSKPGLPSRNLGCVPRAPSSGPAPGEIACQLVQPPCMCLCGLHQVHLAACWEEGPHLLQQRRLGTVQAGSEVLVFLGVGGLARWGPHLTPSSLAQGHVLHADERPGRLVCSPGRGGAHLLGPVNVV